MRMRQFAGRWAPIATVLTLALFAAACLHQSIVASTRTSILSDEPRGDGRAGGVREPYVDRWRRRFSSRGGHVFFKHIRKAGGTLIRHFLVDVFEHHGHGTFEQFLQSTDRKEAARHFPFLDNRQRKIAERYFNQTRTVASVPKPTKVYYVEQEFSAMDWECRDVDRRWNDSLSVVVLRHPIERHLSEFFYSGRPATDGFGGGKSGGAGRGRRKRLRIDRRKLYANGTYTHALSMFLQERLRPWVARESRRSFWYLGPHYTDNHQLRALAGCSSGECLDSKGIGRGRRGEMAAARPAADAAAAPTDSACTMHPFYLPTWKGLDVCLKDHETCPDGCDGPCFHPAAAWGPLDGRDLSRAVHALEGFDVVLLAETLDDEDQAALLSDVMGVPREISISTERVKNVNMPKKNAREKTHFYRDLIGNLTYPHLVNSFVEENSLEISLYDHAVRLNGLMTERWKREARRSEEDEGENEPPATNVE